MWDVLVSRRLLSFFLPFLYFQKFTQVKVNFFAHILLIQFQAILKWDFIDMTSNARMPSTPQKREKNKRNIETCLLYVQLWAWTNKSWKANSEFWGYRQGCIWSVPDPKPSIFDALQALHIWCASALCRYIIWPPVCFKMITKAWSCTALHRTSGGSQGQLLMSQESTHWLSVPPLSPVGKVEHCEMLEDCWSTDILQSTLKGRASKRFLSWRIILKCFDHFWSTCSLVHICTLWLERLEVSLKSPGY